MRLNLQFKVVQYQKTDRHIFLLNISLLIFQEISLLLFFLSRRSNKITNNRLNDICARFETD